MADLTLSGIAAYRLGNVPTRAGMLSSNGQGRQHMWAMDKAEFRRAFESKIRVRMDWEVFEGPDVQAYRKRLQLPDHLDRLWTPWYLGGTDGPPPETPDAEPLSVLEAAAQVAQLGHNAPGVHRHVLEGDSSDYEAPALWIPGGRFLLLDRNHHTVAAAILRTETRVSLAVLDTRPGTRLLVDLPRW